MKAVFERKSLLHAVKGVSRFTPSRSPVDSMLAVAIEFGDGTACIHGGGVETEYSEEVPYTATGKGGLTPILTPSVQFRDLINAFPEADITLEVKDRALVVECRKGRHKLPCLDPAMVLPVRPWPSEVVCSFGPELRVALRRALSSVLADDTRPRMTGVLIGNDDGNMLVMSIDGSQAFTWESGEPAGDWGECIVPGEFIRSALDALPEDETWVIGKSGNEFGIRAGSVAISSSVIGGTLDVAAVRGLASKEGEKSWSVRTDELRAALSRLKITTDTTNNSILRCVLEIEGQELRIWNQGISGASCETVEVESEADADKILLSAERLSKILASGFGEKIRISDAERYVFIRPDEPNGARTLLILTKWFAD